MIEIYKKVQERLDKLDFEKLYPGFHRFDFALYNKENVVMNGDVFSYSEAFIGNTTIEYNGKNIAIWNMQYPVSDINIFTSKIVHEMFHAYQVECKETRFPNEFDGLYYQYNHENVSWKIKETKILIDSYKRNSISLFSQFLASRNERKKKYTKEVEYENKVETVEGLARLIELKTLNQLDKSLRELEVDNTVEFLVNDYNYLPIRKISYFIGSFIVLVADKLNIGYKTDSRSPVFEWFKSEKFDENILSGYEISDKVIDNYHDNNKRLIDDFFKQELIEIDKVTITGLDPMNTIKNNGYLLFDHFVRVKSKSSEKNFFGKSCIKLNDKSKMHKLYIKKDNIIT